MRHWTITERKLMEKIIENLQSLHSFCCTSQTS